MVLQNRPCIISGKMYPIARSFFGRTVIINLRLMRFKNQKSVLITYVPSIIFAISLALANSVWIKNSRIFSLWFSVFVVCFLSFVFIVCFQFSIWSNKFIIFHVTYWHSFTSYVIFYHTFNILRSMLLICQNKITFNLIWKWFFILSQIIRVIN